MKFKKWNIHTPADQDVARLREAGYPYLLSTVLAARGITTAEEAAEFLDRERSLTISPMRMRDMDRAVERIQRAIAGGETIAVFGDYDVDGITSTVLLRDYLKSCGVKCLRYIPRRIEDGYGLSKDAIQSLWDQGATLMITVDCGVTGNEEVDFAASLGMDVVITDHHECKETLPNAMAVVDPHRPDCPYPFKHLAGVGVALKLVLALGGENREDALFARYCTLAAIGTIADVMRMEGENRTIVSYGLEALPHTDFVGIHALLREAGLLGKPITSIQIGFVLSPRINAAGRLGTMENGIECLLSDDPAAALAFAESLNSINTERRELESEMQQLAEAALSNIDLDHHATFTIFNPSFNEGVVGLVAARLKERIHRPVIAFAPTENGELKGSGRSIPGIHLRDALDLTAKALPGVVLRFGGHAMAAGLSIKPEGFKDFQAAFEEVIRSRCDASVFERVVLTDGGLAPDEITEALCQEIDEQIWGQGFEAPLFANEVHVLSQTLLKGTHLKMMLELGGSRFDAIFFRRKEPLASLTRIAYRPSVNEFRGRRTVQLVVEAAE